jgi:hypothetical protein
VSIWSVITWQEPVTFYQLYRSVARTSYILSVIPWQESVTFYQLYRDKNQLHCISYTVARTSYILSVIPWQEPVTFYQLYRGKNQLHLISYTVARTSYISMRWYLLCTRLTFFKKNRLNLYTGTTLKQQSI